MVPVTTETTETQDSRAEIPRLARRLAQLHSLVEVSALIGSSLDLSEVLNGVMQKAKAVMEAEAASILLFNERTNKLEFEVAVGEGAPGATLETLRKTIALDLGQGIAGAVALSRQPELIADVPSDPRFYKNADKITGFITRSMLAAPMIVRDKLVGVAEVLNPRHGGRFTPEDLELFSTYCRQAAVAIENARLHTVELERLREQQQLEFAAMVQQSFLPQRCPV
jgi:sigma-B regulation protein RsbU (phosphoserine phosphatase)